MLTQRSVVRPRRRGLRPGIPRIDWSNPLTRGLIACYVPKDATGGRVRNLTGLGADLSLVSTSIAQRAMTQDGMGQPANVASSGATFTPAPDLFRVGQNGTVSAFNSVTLFWRGMATANPVTDIIQMIGVRFDSAPGSSPFLSYGLGRGTGAALDNDSFCAVYSSGGGYHSVGFNLSWSSNYGRMYSMGITFVLSGAITLYLDGVAVANNGGANNFSPGYATNATLELQCVVNETSAIGNVTGTIAGISRKAWTAADHLAWAKNPYGFLIFPEERVMPPLRAGTGVNTIIRPTLYVN